MTNKIREIEGWQIEEREKDTTNPLCTITKAAVRNPRSGDTRIYSRFSFGDWVNIVAVTLKKEIVLVRQFRFGSEKMEWEVPGGCIEAGESPLTSGVRELEEETGYIGKSQLIGSIAPNPGIQDNTLYTVLTENAEKKGRLNFDAMEDIETRLVSYKEIIQMLQDGEIRHSFTYTALMLWTLKRGIFTLG